MPGATKHKTVLLQESIDGLDIKIGDIFVDGTLGGGGHTEEVCRRFGNKVLIVGIDLDEDAIERTKERLSSMKCNTIFVNDSFKNLDLILNNLKIEHIDKVLLDVGLSSDQFESSGRGFSFQKDEPLIMSFRKNQSDTDITAREIVNDWDEENIATILLSYGEERFATRIAKAIVKKRAEKTIETTNELVEIILSATPKYYHHRKIHPATKTFQALRITVNDEIISLKAGIEKGFSMLASGGRLAVISFHSLEDRTVKNFFKETEKGGVGKILTKKPIVPNQDEIVSNPRSRSAKLRIIQKL